MAKRGRKAIVACMADLDESLQNQIDEAILSHANKSTVDIFREFGLASRGLLLNTFTKYVGALRKEAKAERINAVLEMQATQPPPTWEEIDRLARLEAVRRLNAGDGKMYELVLLSKSRRENDKLELERDAERRANEKHEAWREDLEKRLTNEKLEADAKLDRIAVEKGISPELAGRIKDLYGINVKA